MLKRKPIPPIPRDTLRVTHTILPHGNAITRLRDGFGTIYCDTDFTPLFSHTRQPALAPWRLALITIFQFLENLSDRQAVHAVLTRIEEEIRTELETHRAKLRPYGAQRIPHEIGHQQPRANFAGEDARGIQRQRSAQSARTATHRQHPYSQQRARHDPPRARHPNRARC
jgi:Transposase domain (DUF772)